MTCPVIALTHRSFNMRVYRRYEDGTRIEMTKVTKNGRETYVVPELEPEPVIPPDISGWRAVRHLWHKAHTLLRAVGSAAITALPEEAIERRRDICFAPCEELRQKNGSFYCGACGCGQNPIARLDEDLPFSKLHFPDLRCPKGKW